MNSFAGSADETPEDWWQKGPSPTMSRVTAIIGSTFRIVAEGDTFRWLRMLLARLLATIPLAWFAFAHAISGIQDTAVVEPLFCPSLICWPLHSFPVFGSFEFYMKPHLRYLDAESMIEEMVDQMSGS